MKVPYWLSSYAEEAPLFKPIFQQQKLHMEGSLQLSAAIHLKQCWLSYKETAVQMAKGNEVRWNRHVLRRDDGHVLSKALEFEVRGKRKPGRPKKTWKTQVEKESKSFSLEKKDTINRVRWRVGVREIAARVNPPPSPRLRG